MSHKIFNKGERVMTRLGPGKVNYVTMKGPDYSTPQNYSVFLDARMAAAEEPPFPAYSGTIFPPEEVTEPNVSNQLPSS